MTRPIHRPSMEETKPLKKLSNIGMDGGMLEFAMQAMGWNRQTDGQTGTSLCYLDRTSLFHTHTHSLSTPKVRCKHLLLGGWRGHRATCPGRRRAGTLVIPSRPSGDRTRRPPMLHAAPKGRKRLGRLLRAPTYGIVGNDSSLPRASSCWLERGPKCACLGGFL